MDYMVYVLYLNDAVTKKRKKSLDRMVNEWVNGGHFAMFKNKHIQEQNLKWPPP